MVNKTMMHGINKSLNTTFFIYFFLFWLYILLALTFSRIHMNCTWSALCGTVDTSNATRNVDGKRSNENIRKMLKDKFNVFSVNFGRWVNNDRRPAHGAPSMQTIQFVTLRGGVLSLGGGFVTTATTTIIIFFEAKDAVFDVQ